MTKQQQKKWMLSSKNKKYRILLLLILSFLLVVTFSSVPAVSSQKANQTIHKTNGDEADDVILLIHYHKTGHAFLSDLKKILNQQQNQSLLEKQKKQPKRQHNETTGCPLFSTASNTTVHVVTAPDFFCPINDFLQRDAKIVHFVRNPIEMALSNYLYHSQKPTPEPWVISKQLNPCHYNPEFFKYILQELSEITQEQLDQVYRMCQGYQMVRSGDNSELKQRAFYALLRELPLLDGLKLATAQFLIADNRHSGGDLLRMPNNILRLQEWQKKNKDRKILTVSMDQLIDNMKDKTMEILNFILKNQNTEEIASQMITAYNDTKNGRQRNNNTLVQTTRKRGGQNHISQSILNSTERQILHDQLEQDEVLGPIFMVTRSIVEDALMQ